ncbi:MAG: thioether cross-link-forming SCIFF peptide maturase [Clostridiales Family XIII bacterium]|jgi:uncharacterized protein|nr:thioether cross-link-forming SCIFF peptide maturase [Clostridiales Family XIII bacterium]
MIHLYRFRDINVLLDVGSGAVHTVSDTVSGILSFFSEETGVPDGCREALGLDEGAFEEAMLEIEALREAGQLFASEDVPPTLEGRGAAIKALCLHAAHDCNMRCAYCFADEGKYAGEKAMLSVATGRHAIDFLIRHSGTRRNLEIDFFGGEPLMNFGVIRELVAYGRMREAESGKHIRFTLTTNGLLLGEDKDDFLNKEMDNIILSIDGRPEVNDRMRQTPAGGGTYAQVIGNCRRMAEKRAVLGLQCYVRGTYTAWNRDFSADVEHLAKEGFRHISVEPVVADASLPYALTEADIPALCEEYDRLADDCLARAQRGEDFSFFHYKVDLTQGPCAWKRAAGCGAGTEYVAVSAAGDIYPCHQFVGEEGFRLGNVTDAHFDNRLYGPFIRAHVGAKEDCLSCWAKYYCSGGCHANALHANGDIMKPHRLGCALERKRLECAIGIQAKLFLQGQEGPSTVGSDDGEGDAAGSA